MRNASIKDTFPLHLVNLFSGHCQSVRVHNRVRTHAQRRKRAKQARPSASLAQIRDWNVTKRTICFVLPCVVLLQRVLQHFCFVVAFAAHCWPLVMKRVANIGNLCIEKHEMESFKGIKSSQTFINYCRFYFIGHPSRDRSETHLSRKTINRSSGSVGAASGVCGRYLSGAIT